MFAEAGELQTDPDSRRILVSAWNVSEIERMKLPPCHTLFQFYSAPTVGLPGGAPGERRLSCQLYQRSADVFLGVPFNIASYALLTLMIARVTGHQPGDFVHTFGDAHLYLNHVDQAKEQLGRDPRPLPQMVLDPEVHRLEDFRYESFELRGYDPHPHIKAPIAV